MNMSLHHVSSKVEALRAEFDGTFASVARPPEGDVEQFLAIRSAGQPLALRIAELTRLEGRREIVRLPGENRDLLGIAGIQGRLVPVYCLASLLGLRRDAADWEWIAVCNLPDPLGLSFESLDAFFSVPRASVLSLDGEKPTHGMPDQAVRFADEVRNVVQLRSLQAALRSTRLQAGGAIKES